MTHIETRFQTRTGRGVALAAATLGVLLGTACTVTNPGPVNDEFLTLPAAQEGFVNGGEERLNEAFGYIVYSTAFVSREVFPGGTIGSYGFNVNFQAGNMDWTESGPNGAYANIQQARWVSEEAVRRLTDEGNADPKLLYRAYLDGGYANRILGENWCESVIDGGALGPGDVYFKRAEDEFSSALQLAPTQEDKYAALAGRAQVRMWLGDWAGAVSDATQVPDDFNYYLEMDFSHSANPDQRNQIFFGGASKPYRSYSIRFTYYDDYYDQTGDPRTPWASYPIPTDNVCVGSLQGYGGVPCTQQRKYLTEDDDIRLSSGHEMRLIEAEAMLVNGDWQGAMAKINALRATVISDKTGQPLEPWTASSLDEAWTRLKRERGIEMWLEGRRMGDQRRWEPIIGQPATPGNLELPDFESLSTLFTQYPRGREVTEGSPQPRVLCFNISNDERNSNPNIPDHS